jgi:hypothetical protein
MKATAMQSVKATGKRAAAHFTISYWDDSMVVCHGLD